jgi:hypothetical protein
VGCSALHGATAAEIGAGIAVPVAPGRDLPAQPEHVAPHAFAAGTPGTRAPPRA